MNVSKQGVDFIKRHEGLRTTAYRDVGGLWTIGYGHLIRIPYENYYVDNPISEEMAENILQEDLKRIAKCVELHVKVELTQQQFDALVAFVFNVGCGAFERSTLLQLLNLGEITRAAEQFLRWNKVNKQPVKGLTKRREQERNVFLNGDYDDKA